jgi:ferredoxin-NADP reductase
MSTADRTVLRMRDARVVAENVVEIELESMAGLDLPAWEPGAHIEVTLPSGLIRHYSLCGSPSDRGSYRIAVLREPAGRGGSDELHLLARPSARLTVRAPRNNFEFTPASRYLFVGGGIGITPLLPMMARAHQARTPWRLVYGGRTRTSMAYRDELVARYPDSVQVFADDAEGRPDLRAALAAEPDGTVVYACGPAPMLDHLISVMDEHRGRLELRLERFAADAADTSGEPFEVELARTGDTYEIDSGETILGVLRDRGVSVPFSCEKGYCGTCETVVLDGEPDHRDTFLTPQEREDSFTMMICVSRCAGDRLVLDV